MITTKMMRVFDRRSKYGTIEMFGEIEDQRLANLYEHNVREMVERRYDGKLAWCPETSEIWIVDGNPDPVDFAEWWGGEDFRTCWEETLHEFAAVEAMDLEVEGLRCRYGNDICTDVYVDVDEGIASYTFQPGNAMGYTVAKVQKLLDRL